MKKKSNNWAFVCFWNGFYKSVFISLILKLPCNVCIYVNCGKRPAAADIWFKFRQNVNDGRFVLKCTCQGVYCGYVELFLLVLVLK